MDKIGKMLPDATHLSHPVIPTDSNQPTFIHQESPTFSFITESSILFSIITCVCVFMSSKNPFKLALICGGPSRERGISLNSARSVMDHLSGPGIEIIPLYVDTQKKFYTISPAQLYSNTPADFDYKLNKTAKWLDEHALKAALSSVDLVFPLIHGAFGEDGSLQVLLESLNVPFIGHSSSSCQQMFHKYRAAETLRQHGFFTVPQLLVAEDAPEKKLLIERFFNEYALQQAVVKPAIGGSSIGVFRVCDPAEALRRIEEIFSQGIGHEAIVEPLCEGSEFTVVVFQNPQGEPVALTPTEVELNTQDGEIFDYRKKYLPTNQAVYHTPSRFPPAVVEAIRSQAEQLFSLFGMRDFVRLDGWLLKGGEIFFSDINPLSGLEQNSFFFRQTSLVGMTHRSALQYLVSRACRRYGIMPPHEEECCSDTKSPVYVLFGNGNAERQVSLMSGTNVWLKLLQSKEFYPVPYFLDRTGHIWELPYPFTLNHTVEEIHTNCLASDRDITSLQAVIQKVCCRLTIPEPSQFSPFRYSLEQFLDKVRKDKAFLFLALHGAEGENGVFQQKLEQEQIFYNGSKAAASALCMDKYQTASVIRALNDPDITSLPKKNLVPALLERASSRDYDKLWNECCAELQSNRLIIKPRYDGCSAGIVVLESAREIERYFQFVFEETSSIPAEAFSRQHLPIEMPTEKKQELIVEPYVETDTIRIANNHLYHTHKTGWVELTVGLLEQEGEYYSFNPSITVAEGTVLSLEEKFQGGTGVNLTPPPGEVLSSAATNKIKMLTAKAAAALGIQNYARIDIFFNRITEKMIVIEANTLPALTPSTVIYQQGLSEDPPLYPKDLLERIIGQSHLPSVQRRDAQKLVF
jgi:D-alanine--D-alanine ligase